MLHCADRRPGLPSTHGSPGLPLSAYLPKDSRHTKQMGCPMCCSSNSFMAISLMRYYGIVVVWIFRNRPSACHGRLFLTDHGKYTFQGLEGGATGRRDSELSVVGTLLPWAGRKLSAASITGRQGRAGSLSQHEEMRLHKHLRVVRILLLNVLAVLFMWLPITIVMLLIYVDGRRPTEDTKFFLRSYHFVWTLIVAQLNTVVNPLLYGVFSENFRVCFAKLWRRSLDGNVRTKKREESKKSSKSLEALQNRLGGIRTPSSSRNQQKQSKKSSSCSIGSIVEVPSSEKM